MITSQQQAQVDAIKSKYGYKGPQQATQPQNDWFTATAPKAPLPFDIANPTQESARATATKTLKDTGGEIFDAGKSGVERAKQGFQQSNTAKNPLELVEGAIKMGEGAVQTATAPLAPIFKPIGEGINKVAYKISDIPAVQKFATSKAGERTARAAEDISGLSTIAGAVAGVKAPEPILEKAGAATQKGVDVIGAGVSKVKDILPERPHPIDALRGYADTKIKASMQNDITSLLKSTKSLAKKTEEAGAKGTDFNKILSDPQVFKGLKVENGKINPDEAIKVVDDRIDALMTAKKGILPKVDQIVPKTSKQVLEDRAIEYLKNKELPYDEVGTIKRLQAQMDALPEYLAPSQIDGIRAMARKGARDAKGQMKSTSEYAALETAARDTVFDITDNLPVKNAGEYKALNDYIKQMIQTQELLDGPLRSQVVKGGRMGSYSGRIIGAVAGTPGGPLGSIAASYAGGAIADIITNNSLGSSFKMSLIQQITDDPAILAQAQRLLQDIQEHQIPMLPPGRGNPSDVQINTPIEMGPSSSIEPQAPQSALGNNQRTNVTPAQTENTNPINQSMPESIASPKGKSIPRKGTIEQLAEEHGGWQPGDKTAFDHALLTKDAKTIQEMLPRVPEAYKKSFADDIKKVLSEKKQQLPSQSVPESESALSFIKNNIGSQRGMIKNPFAADAPKDISPATVATKINGQDIGLIQNYVNEPTLHNLLELQPVIQGAGLDKLDPSMVQRFFQEVIQERNSPEFGAAKTTPLRNADNTKLAGSKSNIDVSKAVENHIISAKQIVDTMSQQQISSLGGLPKLMNQLKENIVMGIKAEGASEVAKSINSLNPLDFRNFDEFVTAIRNVVNGSGPYGKGKAK